MTNLELENPDGSVEKRMEWEEWFNKYQPVMINATQDDGEPREFDTCQEAETYIKEQMPCVPAYQREKHVWTETGGDGWNYTSTGYHVVDRMHCYVCQVPWVNTYEACMYEDFGTYCEYCDRNVHSCEHDEEVWEDEDDIQQQHADNYIASKEAEKFDKLEHEDDSM